MIQRRLARLAGAFVVTTAPLLSLAAAPVAVADPCSDVEVVFARGTHQEPGLGNIGQAFVDSLTSDLQGKSVGVYAVNYPANDDYHGSSDAGSADAVAHIQGTVGACPNTKLVLGGYSQGATVINLASNALPPAVAPHVAAIAQFGEPTSGFSSALYGGQPLPQLNPLYAGKRLSLCAPDDPICSPGGNIVAHVTYIEAGLTAQAAQYAADRVK